METVLAGLFGVVLGAYLTSYFERRNKVSERETEWKNERYSPILLLMLALVDPTLRMPTLKKDRPDIKDVSDLKEELYVEMYNCLAFASDEVVIGLQRFVEAPTYETYAVTALAIRKDLFGKAVGGLRKMKFPKVSP